MQLQLIRNATMKIEYAGKTILTDPYLADKHTLPSYRGISPNPLVDLPCDKDEIVKGVDMVLISHIHTDHFDLSGQRFLPKNIPLFSQEEDKEKIENMGFKNVKSVKNSTICDEISIIRTPSRHGTGDVLKEMGETCGFVLCAKDEPTLYWMGDTIWCEEVETVIKDMEPDIIITHSCGAVWGDDVLIVMDAEQTVKVCQVAPKAVVIAVHMEALDHATVSRVDLREFADLQNIKPTQLLIPKDGDVLKF